MTAQMVWGYFSHIQSYDWWIFPGQRRHFLNINHHGFHEVRVNKATQIHSLWTPWDRIMLFPFYYLGYLVVFQNVKAFLKSLFKMLSNTCQHFCIIKLLTVITEKKSFSDKQLVLIGQHMFWWRFKKWSSIFQIQW